MEKMAASNQNKIIFKIRKIIEDEFQRIRKKTGFLEDGKSVYK